MPKQIHQRKIARCEGNLPWVFPSQGDELSKTEIKLSNMFINLTTNKNANFSKSNPNTNNNKKKPKP